jgi:hypothetical protein
LALPYQFLSETECVVGQFYKCRLYSPDVKRCYGSVGETLDVYRFVGIVASFGYTAYLNTLNLAYNASFEGYTTRYTPVLQHLLCVGCGIVRGKYKSVTLLVVGVEAGSTIWLPLARNGCECEYMMPFDEIYNALIDHLI